jgi:hypothetical protein
MTNTLFNKNELNKFAKIYSSLSSDDEFEIMFGGYTKSNSLNMKQFLDILKTLKLFADDNKLKISHTETLDISYNYDNKNFHTYRISIDGTENINKLMSILYNRQNHIIFSVLASKLLSNENKNLSIINKKKDFDSTYNLDDYDIRIRLAKEEKVEKKEIADLIKLDNVSKIAILFRMKSRVSIVLESNSEVELALDITAVKQSHDINKIQYTPYSYELEIDFNKKKSITAKKEKEYMEKILYYIEYTKKVIEQSNVIVSNSEKEEVMKLYKKLLYDDENVSTKSLYGPSVKSLEVVHMVDELPNKYSVTDKADGDRCLGIIMNNKLYFIFTNLEIKYSGVELDKKYSLYNNTIIDGEYILNTQFNKYIYAAFDILYYKGENIQRNSKLEERYEKLNDVIAKCFGFDFSIKKYSDNFDMKKINKYYENQLSDYLKYLMTNLGKSKLDTFVCFKYFIFVLGGADSEIFSYSDIIWNTYTKSDSKNVPYILDGLIYTPLDQIYTKSLKETKHRNYKWKPANKNSIDFFVRFEKDPQTGKLLNVYDDASGDNVEGVTYKILNLHVGKVVNNIEVPVLFRKFENLHVAKLGSVNGMVRDIEGDIIQDNTVVEFYYNDDSSIPPDFRWVPIRTRHDKTESVIKYKKKYGNNADIANAIWNSMQENITIDDIAKLGDENLYENEMLEIKKRIDATVVAISKQKDVYYQKTTDFAKPLRNFNNYIKSNIIFTYCSPKKLESKIKRLSVLDYGCGRGGDIQKFFHAKIDSYVGFDPDSHGIHSSTNGAISRYNNFRRKMPNFPNMEFLIGDGSALLDLESQEKAIGKMSDSNKHLIESIFGSNSSNLSNRKFDVFNCQLMIHFLLKNDTTWNNFCSNVNNFLEDDGYILITCFDGQMIHDLFNKNLGRIEQKYTTDEGVSKKFFEYKSSYDYKTKNIDVIGLSYNAFVTMLKEEDNYDTEYIVTENFLKKSLKERCNMDLVETASFYDIYKQKNSFFEEVAPKEENKNSKNYFMKISEFYNQEDSVNKASLEFCKLHRYYVFKKRAGSKSRVVTKEEVKSRKVSKKDTTKKTSRKVKETSKKKSSRKSKESIKVKKPSKKNNLIDKYLNSSNVLDI